MACLVEIVSIVARPVVFVFMRDPSICAKRTGDQLHPPCQVALLF
jgi:hypothetical protein